MEVLDEACLGVTIIDPHLYWVLICIDLKFFPGLQG